MNSILCRLALISIILSITSCSLVRRSEKSEPVPPPQAETEQEAEETPPQRTAPQKLRVIKSGARLRSGPSTGSDILAVLIPGEVLNLVSDMGSWMKVEGPDGADAYIYWNLVERVSASEITDESTALPPVEKPATTFGEVKICITAVGANVRSGPGTQYDPPFMSVPDGTVMEVDGRTGNWFHGTVNGTKGWIHSSLFRKEDEEQETPSVSESRLESEPNVSVYEPSSGPDESALKSPEKILGNTILGDAPVKVREGPSPLTRVITELEPGTQVEILEDARSWIKIKVSKTEGYVPASALMGESQ